MSTTTVGASDQLATPPLGPAPLVTEIKGGRWSDVWRAISRNKKALVGVLLLLVFVVLAIFPGQIAPDDPTAQIYDPALGPSWHHLLGTTGRGEDVFSQLVWGTRLSLVIALAVGGLATALSVLIGVSAAYLGGIADGILSLLTDVILVLPIFPLIIVIAAYRRNSGLFTLIVVLGALGWSYGARQLRSQTLSLRTRDFLESARVRGERKLYVILFEILPTMTSLIVATFLGAALYAVLTAAGLPPNAGKRKPGPSGTERRGALCGHAALGDRARRLHRAPRRVVRPAQLRLRRDQQSRPAGAQARA